MKPELLEFLSRARVIGGLLTLVVVVVGFFAKWLWRDIDYTQILLMTLSAGLSLLSYGIGAAHERSKPSDPTAQPKEGE